MTEKQRILLGQEEGGYDKMKPNNASTLTLKQIKPLLSEEDFIQMEKDAIEYFEITKQSIHSKFD